MRHKSDPFQGRATTPLPKTPKQPPAKAARFNFALDSTTYRRLSRARQNRDYIPGRRIA